MENENIAVYGEAAEKQFMENSAVEVWELCKIAQVCVILVHSNGVIALYLE